MDQWTVEAEVPAGELRVWLDDLLDDRAAPPGWVHVTTAPAAIALIDRGDVVELSLDHDLGDDDIAGKGVHVVDHIADVAGRDLWPRDGITIHSANAAGRDQMARTIERYAGEAHSVHRTTTASGKPRFDFDCTDTPRKGHQMKRVAQLGGSHNTIDIVLGGDAAPRHAPLICASEVGYSPLGGATAGHSSRPAIECLVDWMRDTTEGAYVALVDAPPAPRRLGIVQDNRSSGERPNFYQRRAPDEGIWRDFYYATTHVLFEQIDKLWGAPDVELCHPTGHDWPPDLVPTVLDAIGHLADGPALALKRVHLSCLHNLGEPEVQQAMKTLNREQLASDPPMHHKIDAVEVPVETLVDCAPGATRIFQIRLVA